MSYSKEQKEMLSIAPGVLVERDVWNVVEQIRAYDPNLRVKYLEDFGGISDAPYIITEMCRDGVERLVFSVWELDQRVLDRLHFADSGRVNILAAIDKKNAAVKADQNRRYRDSMDEANDIAKHVFSSPKGRYSFPNEKGIVTIDDDPQRGYTIKRKES